METETLKTEKRKVNELGLFVIPYSIRNILGIECKQELAISVKNNKIILIKNEDKELSKDRSKVRRIDELGRIVIPLEIRKMLDIKENDELNIDVEGNSIILSK